MGYLSISSGSHCSKLKIPQIALLTRILATLSQSLIVAPFDLKSERDVIERGITQTHYPLDLGVLISTL